MALFYEIIYENGKTLRYKIEDTPVAKIWVEVTKEFLDNPNCRVYENQWYHGIYNLKKIKLVWNRMLTLIDRWNQSKFSNGRKLSMPLEYDENKDYKDLLNRLHETFHRFEEEIREKGIMMESYDADPLQQLNVDIHTLESCLYHKEKNKVTAGFYLEGLYPPKVHKIEDPSLYQNWTAPLNTSGLYLGYHTIGKNLEMCYLSNDVELIEKDMVRPQLYISNEVVLFFKDNTSDMISYSEYFEIIKNWVIENKLEKYIDLTDPKHTVGSPLLGKLVTEMTVEEADTFLWDTKVVASRFVEE